jgi:hypothetical protein
MGGSLEPEARLMSYHSWRRRLERVGPTVRGLGRENSRHSNKKAVARP